MKSEQEVYDLARRMVLRVLDMKPGDRTTVATLVHEIEPSLLEEEPGNAIFEGSMFDVTEALFDLVGDEGDLLLDMSEHDGKLEGLPFNLDFIVRRRIEGKHLDVDSLLNKLEWFHFAIGDYFLWHPEITFRKDESRNWIKVDEPDGLFSCKCEKVSERDIDILKQLVSDSNVLTWDENYWAPVLDGTQWKLQMRFSDGTYFESDGSNSFPGGFNILVDGLIKLGLKMETCDHESEWISNWHNRVGINDCQCSN